ncbi:MAG: NUDIX hydrolase [Geminicoccaceae bacterium]
MTSGTTTSTFHCTACGTPAEKRIPDDDDRERDVCPACGQIHYINPKVVVGAVCHFGEKLLLCRRAIEPRTGYWTIPAGFMEAAETAEQGAAREAWEEARARIETRELIAVYSIARLDQVQILYRAILLNEDVAPGPESLEVALFGWDEIPWEDLAFPTVRWVLERSIELRAEPRAPVVTVGNPPHFKG